MSQLEGVKLVTIRLPADVKAYFGIRKKSGRRGSGSETGIIQRIHLMASSHDQDPTEVLRL